MVIERDLTGFIHADDLYSKIGDALAQKDNGRAQKDNAPRRAKYLKHQKNLVASPSDPSSLERMLGNARSGGSGSSTASSKRRWPVLQPPSTPLQRTASAPAGLLVPEEGFGDGPTFGDDPTSHRSVSRSRRSGHEGSCPMCGCCPGCGRQKRSPSLPSRPMSVGGKSLGSNRSQRLSGGLGALPLQSTSMSGTANSLGKSLRYAGMPLHELPTCLSRTKGSVGGESCATAAARSYGFHQSDSNSTALGMSWRIDPKFATDTFLHPF